MQQSQRQSSNSDKKDIEPEEPEESEEPVKESEHIIIRVVNSFQFFYSFILLNL